MILSKSQSQRREKMGFFSAFFFTPNLGDLHPPRSPPIHPSKQESSRYKILG
jgi:hypothetical protein